MLFDNFDKRLSRIHKNVNFFLVILIKNNFFMILTKKQHFEHLYKKKNKFCQKKRDYRNFNSMK